MIIETQKIVHTTEPLSLDLDEVMEKVKGNNATDDIQPYNIAANYITVTEVKPNWQEGYVKILFTSNISGTKCSARVTDYDGSLEVDIFEVGTNRRFEDCRLFKHPTVGVINYIDLDDFFYEIAERCGFGDD